jgi:hypothetical protein
MTASERSLHNGTRLASMTPSSRAPRSRHPARLSAAVAALWAMMLTTSSLGDAGLLLAAADAGAASRPQGSAAVNAEAVSCKELKDRLQSAGTLSIASGQRAWGETFYGPAVPQCEFWQMPRFSYVNTNDGACGAGYVCVGRIGK